ncbi:11157_t:CDS:2 [Ambispora leptoticha]|uniref:11157_t:CDS:1 n=1 Tax=Ambispora leptoticha TaxID=144679 RepID=A0A9N9F6B1_9GLOM|nr:11157_t:CDS:2 [Ambispora leptoticha]
MTTQIILPDKKRADTERHRHGRDFTVTATDRWMGNSLARGLLGEGKRSGWNFRALTRDADAEPLDDLRRFGAEIVEIDYEDQESLEDALRGTEFMVFVAESDRDRVRQAEALARAARKNEVKGAIVLSVRGVDEINTKTHRDYREMEKIWQEHVPCVAVFRLSFIDQGFFIWSQNIKEEGTINMTLHERDQFTPVNLDDIVRSIRSMAFYEGKLVDALDRRYHQKIFTLTGPDTVTPRDIVAAINTVIRETKVEYERVDRYDLADYLKNLHRYEDDDDYGRERGLSQRTAAILAQRGFALLHEAIADFLKGNERTLEKGANTFFNGISILESALKFLDDANPQHNRFVTNNRNSFNFFSVNNTNLSDQFLLNQSQQGTTLTNKYNIRDVNAPLEHLKSFGVEKIATLNTTERQAIIVELTQVIGPFEKLLFPTALHNLDIGDYYPRPLDVLEYIKEGDASRVTDDVQRLTDRVPEPIDSFFKENKESFAPNHDGFRRRRPGRRHRRGRRDRDGRRGQNDDRRDRDRDEYRQMHNSYGFDQDGPSIRKRNFMHRRSRL